MLLCARVCLAGVLKASQYTVHGNHGSNLSPERSGRHCVTIRQACILPAMQLRSKSGPSSLARLDQHGRQHPFSKTRQHPNPPAATGRTLPATSARQLSAVSSAVTNNMDGLVCQLPQMQYSINTCKREVEIRLWTARC